jgi:hypothetical protein
LRRAVEAVEVARVDQFGELRFADGEAVGDGVDTALTASQQSEWSSRPDHNDPQRRPYGSA